MVLKKTTSHFFIFTIFSGLLWASCTKPVEEVATCDFLTEEEAELVWRDEFDGDMIDDSKWSFDTADGCQLGPDLCGWGNNELQYYTDRTQNAKVENGNLIITARKETPLYQGEHLYTSARMLTRYKGDWRYGRVDVRAKLPIGRGLWPAIWMLPTDSEYGPWPQSGEIDIMEYTGDNPFRIFGTIHYGHDGWRYNTQDLPIDTINFSEDFHVYTVLWSEQCIQFQVDGIDVGVPNTRSTVLPTTWPFDQRFYLILNIAVGGNLPGNPDATTSFPQTMEVDYVRVYQ